MFAQFARWFQPDDTHISANSYYIALVEQARNPFFYTSLQVPDTLDGRFDMLLLHVALLTQRLQQEGEKTLELRRYLTETFIQDMDQNLREMGVSDTGVSKKMKKMTQAYFGRLVHYENALMNTGEESLEDVIAHNIYRTDTDKAPHAKQLAAYTKETFKALSEIDYAALAPDALPFAILESAT